MHTDACIKQMFPPRSLALGVCWKWQLSSFYALTSPVEHVLSRFDNEWVRVAWRKRYVNSFLSIVQTTSLSLSRPLEKMSVIPESRVRNMCRICMFIRCAFDWRVKRLRELSQKAQHAACINIPCENPGTPRLPPSIQRMECSRIIRAGVLIGMLKKNRCSTYPIFTYVIGIKLPMFIWARIFSYPKSILNVKFTWNCERSFVLQDPWVALQKRDFHEQKIVRNGTSESSFQLRTWT